MVDGVGKIFYKYYSKSYNYDTHSDSCTTRCHYSSKHANIANVSK